MGISKRYIVLSIVVLVGVIAIVGGVYAYGYYMNQKYEENFKLHYQAVTNAKIYFNDSYSDTKTYTNKQDWDASVNRSMISFKKAIEYMNKSVYYDQQMVNYAPDGTHKQYAEGLLKVNQEQVKLFGLYLEYYNLIVWPNVITNQTKADQLLSDINATLKNIETLNNEKDQIKLLNPNLNDQVQRLSNESSTAIT